jgi:adenosylmethionine-8-amino-7-oxononanoate aminotransferase
MNKLKNIQRIDQEHVWHPYSSMSPDVPVYPVESANGVRLMLTDGRELIDGMSSWWCAIHGYNHPSINKALEQQIQKMSKYFFPTLVQYRLK